MSSPPRSTQGRRQLDVSESSTYTDISSRSTSFSLAMQRTLALEQQLESEANEHPLDVALRRMLSLGSVISTTSSFAERQDPDFREIGKGSIGVVYEHPGTTRCYKLPLLDSSGKLWNNYQIHTIVQEAFLKARLTIETEVWIPLAFWYANKDTSEFWDSNLDKFPFTETFPKKTRSVFCMERVPPIPQRFRHHLIDKYCPGDKESAKSYAPNQDCLVRPLLGRRGRGSGTLAFSLRNFPLHLDQFKELNLNVTHYVQAMAEAMAVLHGVAKVDAMDIDRDRRCSY